jgi:four helix bundle protein
VPQAREDLDRLEQRTRQFTIDVISLCNRLQTNPALRQLSWQLTKAAGSVGANHRAVRRSRSVREFSAKLQVVNEEIDECVFWSEVAEALHSDSRQGLAVVLREARELRALFARARLTVRTRFGR